MALSAVRAVLAGLVVGAGLGVCSVGCLNAKERRAVSVADCVAQKALGLPEADLPTDPVELTEDGLALASQVMRDVKECRAANPPPSDGGS